MATAPTPQKKPATQQGARPQPVPPASPPRKAPDVPDFDIPTDEEAGEDLYQVFLTADVPAPPVKRLGQGSRSGLKLPFDKLTLVNQWFLIPPFPADQLARRKEKQRVSSYVYKKRADGRKFKLIEIDQRFADAVKHPELVGRFGVWRVA